MSRVSVPVGYLDLFLIGIDELQRWRDGYYFFGMVLIFKIAAGVVLGILALLWLNSLSKDDDGPP